MLPTVTGPALAKYGPNDVVDVAAVPLLKSYTTVIGEAPAGVVHSAATAHATATTPTSLMPRHRRCTALVRRGCRAMAATNGTQGDAHRENTK